MGHEAELTNPQRAGFSLGVPARISMELTQTPGWEGTWVTCSGKDNGLQFFPLRDDVPIRKNQPLGCAAWLGRTLVRDRRHA